MRERERERDIEEERGGWVLGPAGMIRKEGRRFNSQMIYGILCQFLAKYIYNIYTPTHTHTHRFPFFFFFFIDIKFRYILKKN